MTIAGNLTVNGSNYNSFTTNTTVEDPFVIYATGQSVLQHMTQVWLLSVVVKLTWQ